MHVTQATPASLEAAAYFKSPVTELGVGMHAVRRGSYTYPDPIAILVAPAAMAECDHLTGTWRISNAALSFMSMTIDHVLLAGAVLLQCGDVPLVVDALRSVCRLMLLVEIQGFDTN